MNCAAHLLSTSDLSSNRTMWKPVATAVWSSSSRVLSGPRPAAALAAVDVAYREPAAALQHAEPFAKHLRAIGHRRERAFGKHAVEASACERQLCAVRRNEFGRFPVRAAGAKDKQIGADGVDAALLHQPDGGAEAAADIGHRVARLEARQAEEPFRQPKPARP